MRLDRRPLLACALLLALAAPAFAKDDEARDDRLTFADFGIKATRDSDGRVTAITNDAGMTIGFTKDKDGRLTAFTGPEGLQFRISRDGEGRETITAAEGSSWQLHRRADGQPLEVVDPAGVRTRYGYDRHGRLATFDSPTFGRLTYKPTALDEGGAAVTITSALGTRSVVSDALGRVRSVSASDGSSLSFERDAAGRVTRLVSDDGTITRSYDSEGRLTGINRPDLAGEGAGLRIEYDAEGRRAALIGPFGRITETRATIRDGERVLGTRHELAGVGARAALESDARGRLRHIRLGEVAIQTLRYSDAGQIASIETRRIGADGEPGELLDLSIMDHNGLGHTTRRKTSTGLETLRHDALQRITAVETTREGESVRRSYRYDKGGNLIERRRGDRVERFTIGAGHTVEALTRIDESREDSGPEVVTVKRDALGRVTRVGRWTYGWDSIGRLTSAVDTVSKQRIRYGHGADGSLLWRETGGRRVNYLNDDREGLSHRVCELDADGKVLSTVLQGPGIDQPLAVIIGERVIYLLRDASMNIVAAIDARGTLVGRSSFSPYGLREGPVDPLLARLPGYKSRWQDPDTGLVNHRDRWYSPELARFVTPDRTGLAHGNPYAFVNNNPIDYVDPEGKFAITALLLTMGTAAVINTGVALVEELIEHDGKLPRESVGRLAAAAGSGLAWGAAAYFMPHTLLGYFATGAILGGTDRFLQNLWRKKVEKVDQSLSKGVIRDSLIGGTIYAAAGRLASKYLGSGAAASGEGFVNKILNPTTDKINRMANKILLLEVSGKEGMKTLVDRIAVATFSGRSASSSIIHFISSQFEASSVEVVDVVASNTVEFRSSKTIFWITDPIYLRVLTQAADEATKISATLKIVAAANPNAAPLVIRFRSVPIEATALKTFTRQIEGLPPGEYQIYAEARDRLSGAVHQAGWNWRIQIRAPLNWRRNNPTAGHVDETIRTPGMAGAIGDELEGR